MPPGAQPGPGEGMSAASGTARTGNPGNGTDPNNQIAPHAAAPVPPGQIIGLPAGRLKDASGAAARPGFRPVLDPPGPSPVHGSYRGKQERPVTRARHASQTAANPLDTAPLLQG